MGNSVSSSVGAGADYGSYAPPPARAVMPEVPVFKREVPAVEVTPTGGSLLGTLDAPYLPAFLENNPLPNGYPWSTLDCQTNPTEQHPNTGVVRSYEFTISRGKIAPDGYERDVILVNGEFPGPTIEANWGDTISVKVNNQILDPWEGFAMHWHGFLHTGAPWEDGVPGVTQCPIAPGDSFTYNFVAELYGTSWYHSHYSAQYAGGVVGSIVVHGPQATPYDIDVGPIMVADWYHGEYFELLEHFMTPNFTAIYADINLINGHATYPCSALPKNDTTYCDPDASVAKFRFQRGKKHLLRFINAGAEGIQRISIDGHLMQVVANDFTPVEPYEVEAITLGIGQRVDVIVTADGELDSYNLRANLTEACFFAHYSNTTAAIYYDDADTTLEPTSIPWDSPDPGTCGSDELGLAKPVVKIPVPEPDVTLDVEGVYYLNDTGHFLWKMNNVTFRTNYNSPALLLSILGNNTSPEEWNIQDVGKAKSVRINYWNNNLLAHPMHMHGFEMYILSEGPGQWDGTIINPDNPQRRDTENVRPDGHLVVQFDAEKNPGIWPFHCHLAWHISMGMNLQFLVDPERVAELSPPQTVAETCRQWGTWTDSNIPDQIDSGL